jgi:hypothetical protein
VLGFVGCDLPGGGGGGGDASKPSVPTGLTANAVSSSQIDLNWSASTDNVGVTGYKVYRGSAYLKSVAGTSASDTGLSPSTIYNYQVSAYDAAGNESAQSSTASATTQAQGPSVPTGLTVGSPTPISLSISWNTVLNATSYQLYRDTSPGGSFSTQVYDGSSTDTVDGSVSPGGIYYYKVRATNSNGSSSLSSAASGQAIGTIAWVMANGEDNFITNDSAYLGANCLLPISGSTISLGGGHIMTVVKKYLGSTLDDIGVIFAFFDNNNYWKFVVYPAGGYGVFKKSGGTLYTIKAYTASSYIHAGLGQGNRLDVLWHYDDPYYYLDFSINENLTYFLFSGSQILSDSEILNGVSGFVAEVRSDESFPAFPVWDAFIQYNPLAYTGNMASDSSAGSRDSVQVKPPMLSGSKTPQSELYVPPR